MKKIFFIVLVVVLFSIVSFASAHVPYFEHRDFSEDKPFIVRKMVTQSKAIYSWLKNDGVNPCKDIDIYKLKIIRPINLYLEIIVPVVDDFYEDFVPWYALVGPGLPIPSQYLPFELPDGYGAIVMENVEPGESRGTFYEPFGGKSYYVGPIFEENISEPGIYYVYCWDPYEQGGDYVLVIGKGEFFGPIDIIRSIINTFIIRINGELHIN